MSHVEWRVAQSADLHFTDGRQHDEPLIHADGERSWLPKDETAIKNQTLTVGQGRRRHRLGARRARSRRDA